MNNEPDPPAGSRIAEEERRWFLPLEGCSINFLTPRRLLLDDHYRVLGMLTNVSHRGFATVTGRNFRRSRFPPVSRFNRFQSISRRFSQRKDKFPLRLSIPVIVDDELRFVSNNRNESSKDPLIIYSSTRLIINLKVDRKINPTWRMLERGIWVKNRNFCRLSDC